MLNWLLKDKHWMLNMIFRASKLHNYLHENPNVGCDTTDKNDGNANAGDDASSLLSCASSSVSVYCTGSRRGHSSRPNCLLKLFHFCSNSSRSQQQQSNSSRLEIRDNINSMAFVRMNWLIKSLFYFLNPSLIWTLKEINTTCWLLCLK